jgi:hypothetical protein
MKQVTDFSVVGCQLSVVCYQLSEVGRNAAVFKLVINRHGSWLYSSVVSYLLSVIGCQLSDV